MNFTSSLGRSVFSGTFLFYSIFTGRTEGRVGVLLYGAGEKVNLLVKMTLGCESAPLGFGKIQNRFQKVAGGREKFLKSADIFF
jgi:hypothetical protein